MDTGMPIFFNEPEAPRFREDPMVERAARRRHFDLNGGPRCAP
jgi:hypothetical protein